MNLVETPMFTWLILPVLIFCARVVDVSIGTLRIVFIARNQKIVAPILGFFEVLIWLVAIGQIFKHLNNIVCYLAYAGGFAMGNYVGMLIENRLALGQLVIRIITEEKSNYLLKNLKSAGYQATLVDGESSNGPLKILFTVIRRKELKKFVNLITEIAPKSFYTVEDVQIAREVAIPPAAQRHKNFYRQLLKMDRKRK